MDNKPEYKAIGIIGGLSPESTKAFYEHLINYHYEKHHDQYYPEIIIFSVNFKKMLELQLKQDKSEYIEEFLKVINKLKAAGADFAVISANTPHIVYDEIARESKLPLLNIIENVAEKAQELNYKNFLLLGTKQTMRSDLYHTIFKKHKLDILTPGSKDQDRLDEIIYKELVKGNFAREYKDEVREIIDNNPADAVILGCTELPVLLKNNRRRNLLDTLKIHAEATLDYAREVK